jgi:hypothetical protein
LYFILIRFPCGLDDLVGSLLSQHLRNGDPSLERCAASVNPKRLKDQQGPHLVMPGSKQPPTPPPRGFFLSKRTTPASTAKKHLVFLTKHLWLLLKGGPGLNRVDQTKKANPTSGQATRLFANILFLTFIPACLISAGRTLLTRSRLNILFADSCYEMGVVSGRYSSLS